MCEIRYNFLVHHENTLSLKGPKAGKTIYSTRLSSSLSLSLSLSLSRLPLSLSFSLSLRLLLSLSLSLFSLSLPVPGNILIKTTLLIVEFYQSTRLLTDPIFFDRIPDPDPFPKLDRIPYLDPRGHSGLTIRSDPTYR
jgi:hypothetical protein